MQRSDFTHAHADAAQCALMQQNTARSHAHAQRAGPPESLDELLTMFKLARKQWPGARVVASSLDEYLTHLEAAVDGGLELPLVTGERARA